MVDAQDNTSSWQLRASILAAVERVLAAIRKTLATFPR